MQMIATISQCTGRIIGNILRNFLCMLLLLPKANVFFTVFLIISTFLGCILAYLCNILLHCISFFLLSENSWLSVLQIPRFFPSNLAFFKVLNSTLF